MRAGLRNAHVLARPVQAAMFDLIHQTTMLLTPCAEGVHINGSTRGVGVTCYSHNVSQPC